MKPLIIVLLLMFTLGIEIDLLMLNVDGGE